MKKSNFIRIGLFALLAAVMVFTSSVSATSTTPNVSRVVYFSIQSNAVCDANLYATFFALNINNVSDSPNEVSLLLYKKDGTLITDASGSNNGLSTEITPGTPITIGPNSTVQYNKLYGHLSSTGCDSRPVMGKIVVHSNNGLILASGEVHGYRRIPAENMWTTYQNSTLLINQGTPF